MGLDTVYTLALILGNSVHEEWETIMATPDTMIKAKLPFGLMT